MARIPYLTLDEKQSANLGLTRPNINVSRALANHPEAAANFGRLGQYLRLKSQLDPRLRELAILQVGYLTGSAYEYCHHIKIGGEFGVSDDDIRAIRAETNGEESKLTELDRAVLKAAREITENLKIATETFKLLERHLDRKSLIDLVLAISYYNCVVRVLASLEIDLEPEYSSYLEAFPLPD